MELIQDLCRKRKKQLGKTSKDIADETDLPLGTINKFFAASSVSPGVVATAAICADLGVSLDSFYGIPVPPDSEHIRQLEQKHEESAQQLAREKEKNVMLLETINAQQRTINGQLSSIRTMRRIIFALLVILALVFIYGITLDILSPGMGLFRGGT